MARQWRHEVSSEWLEARRDIITGSELKDLIPAYKKQVTAGTKAPPFSPGFVGLWAEKKSMVPPETRAPSQAAARGHVMEPYAVADWNMQSEGPTIHHWDDCLIVNGEMGVSPDGLNIPQLEEYGKRVGLGDLSFPPLMGFEVKCYGPKAHMQKALVPPSKLEERVQVAADFMALPSLEEHVLLFYCPDLPEDTVQMFYRMYQREDLEEELELLAEVLEMWLDHKGRLDEIPPQLRCFTTEEEIYLGQDWMEPGQADAVPRSDNVFDMGCY